MKISRKVRAFLAPFIILAAAPIALAQVQSSDIAPQNSQIIQTAPVKIAENHRTAPRASWQGKKVALRGRDVVSFSEGSKPVKGKRKYAAEWDDTKWYFSNEKNRDAFKADPKKYIPEFGGWCPVALSHGELKVGRTNQFTRVDEKLYLNFDKSAQRQFSNNPEPYIFKAKASW